MQFGKTLRQKLIKEWRFYAVDYKALKQALNLQEDNKINQAEFDRIMVESENKLTKFYVDKESWAQDYIHTLEERVEKLREAHANSPSETGSENHNVSSETSVSSVSSSESENEDSAPKGSVTSSSSPKSPDELEAQAKRKHHARKEAYRVVGQSEHFQHFIYAKKSLATFDRELSLILEFLDLNKTAFDKILKKYDKLTGSNIRLQKMEELIQQFPFLKGEVIIALQEQVKHMIEEVDELKPALPEGWEARKVYTIGCFDLFHRGHQNVLHSLREFGYYIVAGIHDDESYFKLKNKYTIDNLETRMKNVKPFVDQLYVIPSTDPLLYIQSVVSEQDIEAGKCCYARGDDMLQFPGREWVESVMPVHFVPRTEACSSSLLRTMYHDGDEELRKKAAFAKTRYDGKPVDEDGNVIKFSTSCPSLSVQ